MLHRDTFTVIGSLQDRTGCTHQAPFDHLFLHQAMCAVALGFHGGVIKSDLFHYLCLLHLHYSEDTVVHYSNFVEAIRTHKFAITENSITAAVHHLLFIHCPSHIRSGVYTERFWWNAAFAFCHKQQANAFLMLEYSIWNKLFWHMLSQR